MLPTVVTPSWAGTNDYFGLSAALNWDGRVAAIGGPDSNPSPSGNTGSAMVFRWVGGAWTPSGNTVLSAAAVSGDHLGWAVALNGMGTSIIVGAPGGGNIYAPPGIGPSYALVFNLLGGVWTQRGAPILPGGADGDGNFGRSVSLSADGMTAVVGAYTENFPGGTQQGSARVYGWNRSIWEQRGATLTSPLSAR